jgi:hypothetical protein
MATVLTMSGVPSALAGQYGSLEGAWTITSKEVKGTETLAPSD